MLKIQKSKISYEKNIFRAGGCEAEIELGDHHHDHGDHEHEQSIIRQRGLMIMGGLYAFYLLETLLGKVTI